MDGTENRGSSTVIQVYDIGEGAIKPWNLIPKVCIGVEFDDVSTGLEFSILLLNQYIYQSIDKNHYKHGYRYNDENKKINSFFDGKGLPKLIIGKGQINVSVFCEFNLAKIFLDPNLR